MADVDHDTWTRTMISRITEAMRAGKAAGQIGMTRDQILDKMTEKLHPAACASGLLRGIEFVRNNGNGGNAMWFLMEDCPFPCRELSKDEILGRLHAAGRDRHFCIHLAKVMGPNRAPEQMLQKATDRALILGLASEEEIRKAYGVTGPYPSAEESASAREQAMRAMQTGRDALPAGQAEDAAPRGPGRPPGSGDKKPAGDVWEWPFKITREEAELELENGAGRRADYTAEFDWAAHNLLNPYATPLKAPSNLAWTHLVQAVLNPHRRAKFFELYDRVKARAAKERKEKKEKDDDMRTQFRFLGACERELMVTGLSAGKVA